MTLPKKGRRQIQVGGETYYWVVRQGKLRPNSPWRDSGELTLTLTIEHSTPHSSKILAAFNAGFMFSLLGDLRMTVTITPSIVHSVIEYALDHDWSPQTSHEDFTLSKAEQLWR